MRNTNSRQFILRNYLQIKWNELLFTNFTSSKIISIEFFLQTN